MKTLIVETAVWPIPLLINVLLLLKDLSFSFYLLSLQLVLCRCIFVSATLLKDAKFQ